MTRTALALSLTASLLAAPVAAQENGVEGDLPDIDAGRETYVQYCASCHGMEGRGNGTMATILTIMPTDLTYLSEMNGGEFPWARTARQIDGRDPFLAHGGIMPIFGPFFEGEPQAFGAIKTPGGQPIVTTRAVVNLLAYLESIQE